MILEDMIQNGREHLAQGLRLAVRNCQNQNLRLVFPDFFQDVGTQSHHECTYLEANADLI